MKILEALGLRKCKRKRGEEDDVPVTQQLALLPTAVVPSATPERSLAAVRMYERGIRMADIAHILEVDERNVAMALVKRARKRPRAEEAAGQQASSRQGLEAGAARREGALQLAARLLHDPPELVCPILHSLMDDPVVAEDGYTYERQGIVDALAHRDRSPMTNQPMGETMLPNRALKSKIQEYKEVLVAEILSVAPCLLGESAEDACALLARAEELVRPKLPDRSARRRLLELLRLRARLPPPHHEGAAIELASLLAQDDDPACMVEVLDRFEAPFDAAAIQSLQEDVVWRLFELAASQARSAGVCGGLGRELVRRYAPRLLADGDEALVALRRLWRVLARLCTLDGEVWDEAAAALLAVFADRLELDLQPIPTRVLALSVELADNPTDLDAIATRLMGVPVPEWFAVRGAPEFAAVLVELAGRQEDGAAMQTLMRAASLDPQSSAVRRSLLTLQLRRLRAGGRVDEPALIELLYAEGAVLPVELLKMLRLDLEELRGAPVTPLLDLVEQLANADCCVSAARVAVLVAQQQHDAGEPDAEHTLRRAFALDRHNEAAAEGVLQASTAAGQRCTRLEEHLRRVEDERAQLQADCVELQERLRSCNETIELLRRRPRNLWDSIRAAVGMRS